MSENKEKYIGESKLNGTPNKKFKFKLGEKVVDTKHLKDNAVTTPKIADEAVTNPKIADGAVSWGKLDHNVQNIINTSGGGGGAGLATEWGDSEELGLTQKFLTEEHEAREAKDAKQDEVLDTQDRQIDDLNHETASINADINAPGALKDRVNALEELGEISVEGGSIQIVNAAENIEPGSGAIPTANAISGFGGFINNSKWIYVIADAENKVLGGILKDGSIEWSIGVPKPVIDYIDGIADEIYEVINEKCKPSSEEFVYSDKWIYAIVDAENKIIMGINKDGKVFANGINGGGSAPVDWSEEKEVTLPFPEQGAKINLIIPDSYYKTAQYIADKTYYAEFVDDKGHIKKGLAYKKGLDWECQMEYWDKKGNYFKKPIVLDAQGNSTLAYEIVNQAVDLSDGSSVRIGTWVSQDSFHLKKFYQDAFRGQSIVAYRLIEEMYLSHSDNKERPWQSSERESAYTDSSNPKKGFSTSALGHPDGFPITLYVNGESVGIYVLSLKKHRDNYMMEKADTWNILLDGILGENEFWGGNTIAWGTGSGTDGFEVRNPNPKLSKDGYELVDMDGEKYDGDKPKELMGDNSPNYDENNPSHVYTSEVKNHIVWLSSAVPVIDSAPTVSEKRGSFETYFNTEFLIDYFLLSNVLYHSDGFRKNWIWGIWNNGLASPTLYDCDSIFGAHWRGHTIRYESTGMSILGGGNLPTKYLMKNNIYWTETKERYKYLRDSGTFSVKHIIGLLEDWVNTIGYDAYKKEFKMFPELPSFRSPEVNSSYWKEVQYIGDKSSLPTYSPSSTYAKDTFVKYTDDYLVYQAKVSVPVNEPPCELYVHYPREGGFYQGINRTKEWLKQRLEYLDTYFEY